MGNMPAQQVIGPASIHGTLSLTAWCNDVQCCSHSMFIIIIGNDDLEQKLNPKPLPCAKVLGNGHAVLVKSVACRLLNS
jgi:hypothetical protein